MPLVALAWLRLLVGLASARAAAEELRARPVHALATRSAKLLLLHDALVGLPVSAALYLRLSDWSLSYAVDAARVPSLAAALALLALEGVGVLSFWAGAEWLRNDRERRSTVLALASGSLVLVGLLASRGRLAVVGSALQYRGSFGLQRLFSLGVLQWLGALFAMHAAGVALHLALVRRSATA